MDQNYKQNRREVDRWIKMTLVNVKKKRKQKKMKEENNGQVRRQIEERNAMRRIKDLQNKEIGRKIG